MAELIRCSKCAARKLPEFYSIKKTTGIRYKVCDNCREKFSKVRYYCSQCDFVGSSSSGLKTHTKAIHTKIRDQSCPHCDFSCSDSAALKRHIKAIHDKIRDIQCPSCEFTCSRNSILACHQKALHDQIRDHECHQCEFKCSERGNLLRHLKICTGTLQMSAGEFAITGVLQSFDIQYEREKRFADCRDKNPLPFDFYIPSLRVAIEFDGRQHFEPISHWGGQNALEMTQYHDKMKNDYCATHDIRLLRVKYTEFELIPTLIGTLLASVALSQFDDNHCTTNEASNEPRDNETTQSQTDDLHQ